MKLQLVLTQATEEQINVLNPLKEKQAIINQIDEIEKINTDVKDSIYVGYFILNDIFNIILVSNAKDDDEATYKALQKIYNQTEIQKELKHNSQTIEGTQHKIVGLEE